MDSWRELLDRKFAVLLGITLTAMFFHYRIEEYGVLDRIYYRGWLNDDDAVKDYIMKSIDTNYSYIELRGVTRPPEQKSMSYFGPGKDIFFRYFTFYQYDPDIIPSNENCMYLGTIDQYGKVRVRHHMLANSGVI